MSDVETLLPHNATDGELTIEQATARVGAVPIPIRSLWNPDTCPANLLAWLAWAMSVDDWDPSWSEGVKREVIRQSVRIHKRKGTKAAVVEALQAAGYGDATVIENFAPGLYDGVLVYDGSSNHATADHWAEYRVQMARPISNAQADQVRKILADIAPLRSRLKSLDFQQVAHLHNNAIAYNGAFNYGAA
jgi:phage tail P2-like protein